MLAAILWLYAQTGTSTSSTFRHAFAAGASPGLDTPRSGSSSDSSSPLPSRCRSSLSTPGCRTRTSKLPPPVRCCSPASCSRWAPMACCASISDSSPIEAHRNAPWIMTLAIIGIIYGALVSLVQPNMKKLIAYSSVSHLGFVVLGIFSFTRLAWTAPSSSCWPTESPPADSSCCAGILYERRHTYEIKEFGGLATPMPMYATFFLVTVLASVGLPLLQRLHRRIPGPERSLPGAPDLWNPRRHRRDLERLLPALDVSARFLRQGNQRQSITPCPISICARRPPLAHCRRRARHGRCAAGVAERALIRRPTAARLTPFTQLASQVVGQ